jgi:hypothetical protein
MMMELRAQDAREKAATQDMRDVAEEREEHKENIDQELKDNHGDALAEQIQAANDAKATWEGLKETAEGFQATYDGLLQQWNDRDQSEGVDNSALESQLSAAEQEKDTANTNRDDAKDTFDEEQEKVTPLQEAYDNAKATMMENWEQWKVDHVANLMWGRDAVEAVEAVAEELDDDGNVVVEAVEGVEAVEKIVGAEQ